MVRSDRDPGVIQLRLLGAVDAHDARGQRLGALLAQPRRLCLLAMLVLESTRGACTRERLMATFWPDHPPEQAATNLRQALAFLRRTLGDGVLVAQGRHAVSVDRRALRCDALDRLEAPAPDAGNGGDLV